MREILFRGQTRRKGEKVRISGEPVDSNWVYGGIFPGEGDFSIIYQTKPKIEKFTVYSDTVGQYTGLTDKYGKRIYEGDLVGDLAGFIHEVLFEDGCFMIKHGLRFSTLGATHRNVEVVGNIYDNPKLLEVTE